MKITHSVTIDLPTDVEALQNIRITQNIPNGATVTASGPGTSYDYDYDSGTKPMNATTLTFTWENEIQ